MLPPTKKQSTLMAA
jgi:hypothetical protein